MLCTPCFYHLLGVLTLLKRWVFLQNAEKSVYPLFADLVKKHPLWSYHKGVFSKKLQMRDIFTYLLDVLSKIAPNIRPRFASFLCGAGEYQ